ncbi:unnamed protein product [Mesocestoides corti]|uniref:Cadherin domain-containing protein n=1 Tax=Mesocestoides corti TaxID=53468 RepID=A0A0R3U338_MESCO|nr:unnamed protein product [Mesocestoides corti]
MMGEIKLSKLTFLRIPLFPPLLLLLLHLILHVRTSSSFLPPFASTFDVVEESPQGTTVAGVAEYLNRIVLLNVEMPNSTTFQLMGMDPLTKSFVINPKSGELRIAARVDREIICKAEEQSAARRKEPPGDSACLRPLNVLIKSQGAGGASESSRRQQLTLRIVDINDNAPRWPGKSALAVKFVEAFDSPPSYGKQEVISESRILERAFDPDAGSNGTVSYALKGSGAEMFRLENADSENGRFDLHTFHDASAPLRLRPVVPLDREVFAVYNLTLFAFDSGQPQLSGSIPLNVYVTDVNDHAPVFHTSSYGRDHKQGDLVKYVPPRGHLMETASVGSFVLQVNATDDDAGENARISYSIAPSDAAFVQAYFVLDPISGHLTVKQRLDYDHGPRRFNFKGAWVSDEYGGRGGLQRLGLLPPIASPPHRKSKWGLQRDAASFTKKALPEVAKVGCPQGNRKWTGAGCTLVTEHSLRLALSLVNDVVGGYVVSPPPPAPCPSTYTRKEVCWFLCTPQPVASEEKMRDDWSSPPRPTPMCTRTTAGTKIRLVVASQVIAVDGALEPYRLTGTAIVDIELTDVNDEKPSIEILIAQNDVHNHGVMPQVARQQELVAYIEETPSPDIVVAYVQVCDADENGEDHVSCHLGARDNFTLQAESLSQGPKSDHFGFDGGAISDHSNKKVSEYRILAKVPASAALVDQHNSNLQGYLDRETTPSQLLTVTCMDRAGNEAKRQIRVHLLDVNDNAPRFVNNSHFNFSVAENREPMGSQQIWLGRVHAVDPDVGENARVSYHLASDQHHDIRFSASHQQLFRVDADTGDVYAQVSLDRENAPDNGVYTMFVLAVDHGTSKQLTGTARVDVSVLDVNDWAPEFTRDIYTFVVSEDVELREVIGTVEAVDKDATAGPNTITYHLNIPRPGLVKRSLKNDTTARVKRDTLSHQQQQQQPLFMPHLEPSKMRDDRPLSYFSIDSRTGEIHVIRKLDREANGYFTFEVLAIDSPLAESSLTPPPPPSPQQPPSRRGARGETFTATATVVVTLTDVNDNAPEFRYPTTSILLHMALGETLGHKILTVQAMDRDDGENARISYSIRSEIPVPPDGPGTGNFAIDETSGLVFLTRPVQGPVNHRIVVEACDHGEVPKCTASPGIQIAVSEDAKLIGGGQQRDRNGVLPNSVSVSTLESGADHRFGYEALYGLNGGLYDQTAPHRVEVIAACLVVVFGVLLLAAVVLACLLKKKKPGSAGGMESGNAGYVCTTLWGCQWPFFKPHSGASKQTAQHYVSSQATGNIHRFSDAQSIESSLAKGTTNTTTTMTAMTTITTTNTTTMSSLTTNFTKFIPSFSTATSLSFDTTSSTTLFTTITSSSTTYSPHKPPPLPQPPPSPHHHPLLLHHCLLHRIISPSNTTTLRRVLSPPVGMLSADSITNTLDAHADEEKKPLYYDGLGMLVPENLGPRGDGRAHMMTTSPAGVPFSRRIRHPISYTTATGVMPQTVVFSGNATMSGHPGQKVYGTLPVVSTIISDPHGANNTLLARSGFHAHHQTVVRPTKFVGGMPQPTTPPSPDYQSLDQLASQMRSGRNEVWQNQPAMELFTSPPPPPPPPSGKPSKQSSSYGCLADPVEAAGRRQRPTHNYYEINPLSAAEDKLPIRAGSQKRYQRSSTLGRLAVMDENGASPDADFMHHSSAGVLSTANNANSRSYSQLQATSCLDDGGDCDKPTRYTYQAIREASFV